MSEEKLVPKLRFSEFDEEWYEVKLNEVGNIVTGATPPTKDNDNFINSGYLWVTPGDISSKKFVSKTERNLSEKGLKNGRKLDPNSILVTCIGATIGKLCMINEIGSCNQQLNAISANKNFYPDFIYYVIQKTAKNLILIAGNTATPILNKKSFGNLSYIFPSFNEQKKIALFLDKIDKKRELLEKKYEFYQDFKKYLMQQIFTQKLRFDFNIIKLNDICDINKGKQLNKENMVNFGEYYVLNGGKEPSGYTNSWNTPANTITISEGGNSCGYVNFNEEKFWSGGHCYYLSNLSSKIDLYYLYSYLKFIEPSIMRLRVGSGLPNIQKGDIENIKVKTLPINEQIKIRNVLRIIDKKISTLKVQKEHFEVFKKGLLQQMFV